MSHIPDSVDQLLDQHELAATLETLLLGLRDNFKGLQAMHIVYITKEKGAMNFYYGSSFEVLGLLDMAAERLRYNIQEYGG